jgi:transposase
MPVQKRYYQSDLTNRQWKILKPLLPKAKSCPGKPGRPSVEKEGKGFHVIKHRWVVERTFSWLINFRRNSKDYEKLTQSSEAMLQIAMIHTLLKRYGA